MGELEKKFEYIKKNRNSILIDKDKILNDKFTPKNRFIECSKIIIFTMIAYLIPNLSEWNDKILYQQVFAIIMFIIMLYLLNKKNNKIYEKTGNLCEIYQKTDDKYSGTVDTIRIVYLYESYYEKLYI